MLIRYELKKIISRKLNLIAMLAGFVILLLCIVIPISDEYYGEDIRGIEAINKKWEFAQSQTEYLTDDFVRAEIDEVQKSSIDIDSDDGYEEIVKPKGKLIYYLSRAYKDISDQQDYSHNNLKKVNAEESFYGQRMKIIEEHLNKDFSFGNYTEAEKKYWVDKAQKVDTPFRWGDRTVPDLMLTIIALSFYQIFVIAICLSSIFAGEKESKADQIVYASRHGKGKLIFAKIIAAYIFSVSYELICTIAGIGIIGAIFGNKSLGLPVQILDAKIPYNLTIKQTMFLQMGVMLSITLFMAALVCIFSVLTQSSLATMVLMIVWIIVPVFIEGSKTNGVFNHINYLFAVRMIDIQNVLAFYIDYKIGNVIIDYVTMGILTHLSLAILITLCIKKVNLWRVLHN